MRGITSSLPHLFQEHRGIAPNCHARSEVEPLAKSKARSCACCVSCGLYIFCYVFFSLPKLHTVGSLLQSLLVHQTRGAAYQFVPSTCNGPRIKRLRQNNVHPNERFTESYVWSSAVSTRFHEKLHSSCSCFWFFIFFVNKAENKTSALPDFSPTDSRRLFHHHLFHHLLRSPPPRKPPTDDRVSRCTLSTRRICRLTLCTCSLCPGLPRRRGLAWHGA